jgi:ribosomal protein L30E
MITITELVRNLVKNNFLLEESLSQGLINLSALAREFKPKIEKKLLKSVKTGTIVVSLKRVMKEIRNRTKKLEKISIKGELIVRSNLCEYIYLTSEGLIKKYSVLAKIFSRHPHFFLTLTQGTKETDIIISESLKEKLENILSGEKLIRKIENLSSITLFHPEKAVFTPGFHYSILKLIAWENINIVETVSTFTEFTIILKEKDLERAFKIIKELMNRN